ncbi:hypothetical protein LN042_00975 [Kitasatospora sp. RB6PN24]|uniref:CBU_0592 family membrane protein n=1 Tax=Kitasatospora humi TaxID=2893891 RepID=UPI001E380B8D|nr:hypothetical protein [Kitasatospora humi]MCC9305694.1 hypothetical protein [Kitasatospora humi]
MEQVVQVFGSILILIPFALAQWGRISARSKPYLLLNLGGSVILAVLAGLTSQWGFLLLEGVWALVSAHSLLAVVRGREPSAPH